MKRIIMCAAAITAAALSAFASGVADGRFGVGYVRAQGPITEREIPIAAFDSLDASGVGVVRWTEAATPGLVVRTHESVMDVLDCRTVGGELRLGFKSSVAITGLRVLEFEVSGPSLRAVRLSGSADFTALSPLESANVRIDISGSGSAAAELAASRADIGLSGSGSARIAGSADDLRLDISGSGSAAIRDIRAERLAVTISGGGGAKISGEADAFEVELQGSGAIAGKDLEAKRVSVAISGSGKVETTATETLDADASGAGAVRYWGNPRLGVRTSGAARVIPGN